MGTRPSFAHTTDHDSGRTLVAQRMGEWVAALPMWPCTRPASVEAGQLIGMATPTGTSDPSQRADNSTPAGLTSTLEEEASCDPVHLYFMRNEPERVQEVAPQHTKYWRDLALPGYLGGPFADRSGGLITFKAESLQKSEQLVANDPFVTRDLVDSRSL